MNEDRYYEALQEEWEEKGRIPLKSYRNLESDYEELHKKLVDVQEENDVLSDQLNTIVRLICANKIAKCLEYMKGEKLF